MIMAKGLILKGLPLRPRCDLSNSRRTANYAPNSWDYNSLSLSHDNHRKSVVKNYYEELKSSIRGELMMHKEKSELAVKLNKVDMLQRLGIAYHFQSEIRAMLDEISVDHAIAVLQKDSRSLALFFRLMREYCYNVIPDGFVSTLDVKNIKTDIEGLLSLYEASFLAFEGDGILDKARIFLTRRLHELKRTCIDKKYKAQIEHALEGPLHWRVPRLEARWFIHQHQINEDVNPLLVTFAKLDYNQLQVLHQGELETLSRWWIDVGLREKLPFARDRLVESFFYATGIAPEPHHADCRAILCKLALLIVTLDDVYDIYGTFDELLLFNKAIQRWDDAEIVGLPEYMRPLFSVLLNTTKEIASYVREKHGWDASSILIKSWQDACNSFLMEAKWYHNSYVPNFEEYLENGWVSSTAPLLLAHAFAVLANTATAEALGLQKTYPSLVQSCATIFRLSNDCATHKAEAERGDTPSSIACYMQEHLCNEQDAHNAMRELIMQTWKKINEDSIGHGHAELPGPFIDICRNLARVSLCIYNGGDGIGAPDQRMNSLVRSLLLDSISLD